MAGIIRVFPRCPSDFVASCSLEPGKGLRRGTVKNRRIFIAGKPESVKRQSPPVLTLLSEFDWGSRRKDSGLFRGCEKVAGVTRIFLGSFFQCGP